MNENKEINCHELLEIISKKGINFSSIDGCSIDFNSLDDFNKLGEKVLDEMSHTVRLNNVAMTSKIVNGTIVIDISNKERKNK